MYIYIFIIVLRLSLGVRILDKGILPLDQKSVGIQFYIDFENEDKTRTCRFKSWPKMCCLYDKEDVDCDVVTVVGVNRCCLKPKQRDTMYFVYPTIYHHDQFGYCNFIIEYRTGNKRSTRKEIIRIDFDTRLETMPRSLQKAYVSGTQIEQCPYRDQDPLNNCDPVNCEMKYNGKIQFYDSVMNRCVRAAACYSTFNETLPNVIYDQNSNTCKSVHNFYSMADMFSLVTGASVLNNLSILSDPEYVMKSNCSTISENLSFLKDMLYGKFNLCNFKRPLGFKENCCKAIKSILIGILGFSMTIICFAFCGNFITTYFRKIARHNHNDVNRWKSQRQTINTSWSLKTDQEVVSPTVKNALLKDVIVSDLPMDRRLDVCDDKIRSRHRWRRLVSISREVNHMETSHSSTEDTEDGKKVIQLRLQ